MQACDRCHARKTRCDRRIPRCGACEKARVQCLHVDKLRSRNLPRAYVEEIETTLRKTREQNLQLQSQLARLRASHPNGNGASVGGYEVEESRRDQTGVTSEVMVAELGQPPQQDLQRLEDPGTATATSVVSSRTPTGDAVASEVGYLTLTATGETRFLGSSSGIGLANIISSVLDPHASSNYPRDDNNSYDLHDNPANLTPVDTQPPPRTTAIQFIDAYFQHTHITFPLLHRPSFLAAVEQIYNHPTYYTMHAFDAFVFDMVLAIGESNVNRFPDSANGATKHYARALTKMQAILDMRGLVPLQAILLLCQHSVFSNMRNTSASIWHLIGIGARMCLEMGLHLEAGRIREHEQSVTIPFNLEMQKRTFWCFYNLDRVVSFTLGRPVALRDDDIDTSLPSPLDDNDFGPDRPVNQHFADGVLRSSPFLQLIEIRRLSGEILSTMYSARQQLDVPVEEKIRVRQDFDNRIKAWKNAIHLLQLEDHPQRGQHFTSCFLTPEWYEAVASNALLLLYRPSPYLPHPVVPTVIGGEAGDLQRLIFAAETSIRSYSDLHRKRRLNYSWIILHGIFIAGLTYVYGIGLALKEPSHSVVLPDYVQIIDHTRACSNILVAICERWGVARRSCDVFNRLSNAAIKATIEGVFRTSTSASAPRRFGANSSAPRNAVGLSNPLDNANTLNSVQRVPNEAFDLPMTVTEDQDQLNDLLGNEFGQYLNGLDHLFFGSPAVPTDFVEDFSRDGVFADL